MNKSIRYFATIILIPLFISCTKEIEFNPKNQSPFLVMNSYLDPDHVLAVSVSQSASIMEKLNKNIVNDALVKVYENETLLEILQYDEASNQYLGAGKPSMGKEYKVTVVKDGFISIDATSVIKPAPEILKCTIIKDNLNSRIANATITFKEPAGVKNFYRLVVTNEDEFSEKPDWAPNDGSSAGSPWVYTNIAGVWSKDPNWDNSSSSAGLLDDVPENIFNIFNDDLIDGKEYSLTFSYALSQYPEAENRTIISLQSITQDLHKYLKTFSAQYYFGDDFLLEPIQVYSNVKNGGGIFGSYNAKKVIIIVNDLVIDQ